MKHLVGYAATRVDLLMREVYTRHVGTPFALRPVEFTLLTVLGDRGPTTAKDLAQALRLRAPNLTTVVDRLISRNFVARQKNAHDGRSVFITLSASGEQLLQRATAVSLQMEDQALACLSEVERQQLLDLLWRVAGAQTKPTNGRVPDTAAKP